MAKMFYTAAETASQLKMNEEQVKELVRNGKLREFRDAGKVNYKAEEVDRLAAVLGPRGGSGPSAGLSTSGEITLEPAEEGTSSGSVIALAGTGTQFGSDMLSLEESDIDATSAGTRTEEAKKDDTVVTSVGVSVFDDDDLAEVDPLAKTAVSDGSEGLGIEAGSGSGLMDLTRESDDTSLGADLLDEIYPADEASVEMGEATRAGLEAAAPGVGSTAGHDSDELLAVEAAEPTERVRQTGTARVVVEYAPDAWSMGMTGLIVAATAVMCVAGLAAASIMQGVWPGLLATVYQKLWIFGAASAVLAGGALGVGFFLGRRAES